MRNLINKLLNLYFYLLFFALTAAEAADILTAILGLANVLNSQDILFFGGILGGISIATIVLTVFTYLIPLCVNNAFPVGDIPNVVNEIRFKKSVRLVTNIPLAISVAFSVAVLIVYRPFSDPNETYKLLWMCHLFLPICFKVGIYYLLWSKKIKQ